MNPRTLPILNAIGCLALTGVVVAQWRKERSLDESLNTARGELTTARSLAATATTERDSMARDITVLKDALSATQLAAETTTHSLTESNQLVTTLQTDLTTARAQVTTWQAALTTRDERLRALDAQLAATRQRLNEAVAKLKGATQ